MDPDGIPGALYQYGSHLSSETITACLNNIFETHQNLEISSGDMITPLNLGNLNVLLAIWDRSISWIPPEKLPSL